MAIDLVGWIIHGLNARPDTVQAMNSGDWEVSLGLPRSPVMQPCEFTFDGPGRFMSVHPAPLDETCSTGTTMSLLDAFKLLNSMLRHNGQVMTLDLSHAGEVPLKLIGDLAGRGLVSLDGFRFSVQNPERWEYVIGT